MSVKEAIEGKVATVIIGGVLVIGGITVAYCVFKRWWKTKGKEEFEVIPIAPTYEDIPVSKVWIKPLVTPTIPQPNPKLTIGGVNWLSGVCSTMQHNILQDLALTATNKMFWVIPVNLSRKDCAARIYNYWIRARWKCVSQWSEIIAYVEHVESIVGTSEYPVREENVQPMKRTIREVVEEMRKLK